MLGTESAMGRRPPRRRGHRTYEKTPLSHQHLLERFMERGLIVDDPDRALRCVRHLGYYRLSPYLIPFRRQPDHDSLRSGVHFDDVLDLYVFDRKLRLLVLDALERIEVAVRAALTDHMAVTTGDAFWYRNPSHFDDPRRHADLERRVAKACEGRLGAAAEDTAAEYVHRSALEHYLLEYGEPELPPSWLMVELLTLGELEATIANLRRRQDRSAVAESLGLKEPLLRSWLRTFVRVRNICAHHGRLWNAVLGVSPAIPQSSDVAWLRDRDVMRLGDRRQRLYPVLLAQQTILATISPSSSWASRLSDLLRDHPSVPLAAMGIPEEWRSDPFWAERLSARGRPL